MAEEFEAELNKWGDKGWELVGMGEGVTSAARGRTAVQDRMFVLKRSQMVKKVKKTDKKASEK
jgi:hypothetical protein